MGTTIMKDKGFQEAGYGWLINLILSILSSKHTFANVDQMGRCRSNNIELPKTWINQLPHLHYRTTSHDKLLSTCTSIDSERLLTWTFVCQSVSNDMWQDIQVYQDSILGTTIAWKLLKTWKMREIFNVYGFVFILKVDFKFLLKSPACLLQNLGSAGYNRCNRINILIHLENSS